MKQCIAIITARGGSKGLPKKNIRSFCGHPLIAYTIKAALSSQCFAKVIVSTDSEEIAEISQQYGASVPFMRPAHLAQDDTTSAEVVIDVLKQFEKNFSYRPGAVALLQPTSPLRTASQIHEAMALFNNSNANSLLSVCQAKHNPMWMYVIGDGTLKPFIVPERRINRRQDLPVVYRQNGAIYIVDTEAFIKHGEFEIPDIAAYIMDEESSFDIDDELDFFLAECVYRRRYEKDCSGNRN